METSSWIIREKATGRVLFETANPNAVSASNTSKYEAVPILEYLFSINGQPEEVTK